MKMIEEPALIDCRLLLGIVDVRLNQVEPKLDQSVPGCQC